MDRDRLVRLARLTDSALAVRMDQLWDCWKRNQDYQAKAEYFRLTAKRVELFNSYPELYQ